MSQISDVKVPKYTITLGWIVSISLCIYVYYWLTQWWWKKGGIWIPGDMPWVCKKFKKTKQKDGSTKNVCEVPGEAYRTMKPLYIFVLLPIYIGIYVAFYGTVLVLAAMNPGKIGLPLLAFLALYIVVGIIGWILETLLGSMFSMLIS